MKNGNAVLVFGFFYVLSIWFTWPCWKLDSHVLPVPAKAAEVPSATVPLFNAWTIWWNSEQLKNGFSSYWDAPIFFPSDGAFAFSEPQPAALLVAPVVWSSGSPIVAYHFYLRLNLALNGLAAFLLLRRLNLSHVAAIAGGIACMLHPLVWDNIDVIQLVPLWGIVWFFGAFIRLYDCLTANENVVAIKPAAWIVGSMALSIVAIASTSIHHLLLFTITFLPCLVLLLAIRFSLKFLLGLLAAAGAAGLLLLPLVLPMKQILAEQDFDRTAKSVEMLSAKPSGWIKTPDRSLLNVEANSPPIEQSGETQSAESVSAMNSARAMNPGWLRVTLAVLAIVSAPIFKKRRLAALLLFGVSVSSVFLSHGANLELGDFNLWFWMSEHFPFLAKVRSVYRFGYFAQLCIILLAVIGVDQLRTYLMRRTDCATIGATDIVRSHRALRTWLQRVFFFVLLLLITIEIPQAYLKVVSVPSKLKDVAWIEYLREEGKSSPILCLPMAQGFGEAALESEARWMLQATGHGCPLLNGYSGFFPESWRSHVARFSKPILEVDDLRYLRALGVGHVVLDTRISQCPRISVDDSGQPSEVVNQEDLSQLVFQDGAIQIWRIRPQ